jgi:uncharacterized protein
MAPCPNCKKPAPPREDNPDFPFCSERCKALDLGRWFGGGYRVPAESVDLENLPQGAQVAEDDEPGPAGSSHPRRKR